MSNLSSSVYLLDLDVVRSEPKLPGYTPRPSAECSSIPVERESKSFEYKLAKNMTGPGISLTVSGNSRISKELPSFMEGDKVAGAVRVLSVNNGQDIRAIDVSVSNTDFDPSRTNAHPYLIGERTGGDGSQCGWGIHLS